MPEQRLSLLDRLGVTVLCQAPTEYRMMAKLDALSKAHLPRLRHAVSAGEPLNPEVIERFQDVLGLTIHDGYGQTENSLLVANAPGAPVRPGSMGLPTPGHDVEVIDESGHICPPGVEGEIALIGKPPTLFAGYWNNRDETNAVFRDGWYLTGDRATRDEDGYLWFVGRGDDVILSAAYRIGPFEVESALLEHPAVEESAVVGIPHAERGQIVKAFVVLRPGHDAVDVLATELQDHVKAITAPYKYPRAIEFVDELPKTASGKIRRSELRARPHVDVEIESSVVQLPVRKRDEAAEERARVEAEEAARAAAAAAAEAAKREVEERARREAAEAALQEAQARARAEAEAAAEKEREEVDRLEAVAAARRAEEERGRAEAEAAAEREAEETRLRAEAEEAARLEAEAAAAREAEEERLRFEAEAEAAARLEAEAAAAAAAVREAEERARADAEAAAQRAAEEAAQREAEEAAQREAEEAARREAEEALRRDAEERSKAEADEHTQVDAEEIAARGGRDRGPPRGSGAPAARGAGCRGHAPRPRGGGRGGGRARERSTTSGSGSTPRPPRTRIRTRCRSGVSHADARRAAKPARRRRQRSSGSARRPSGPSARQRRRSAAPRRTPSSRSSARGPRRARQSSTPRPRRSARRTTQPRRSAARRRRKSSASATRRPLPARRRIASRRSSARRRGRRTAASWAVSSSAARSPTSSPTTRQAPMAPIPGLVERLQRYSGQETIPPPPDQLGRGHFDPPPRKPPEPDTLVDEDGVSLIKDEESRSH